MASDSLTTYQPSAFPAPASERQDLKKSQEYPLEGYKKRVITTQKHFQESSVT